MPILAQQKMHLNASLNPVSQEITIEQEVQFVNTSNQSLSEIYFNDWANSFSSKTTPLATRFAEEYDRQFHFEKNENRGKTIIKNITSANNNELSWKRGKEADILIVNLQTPLDAGEKTTIKLSYTIKVSPDRFTRYGVTSNGNYNLRYWYISPAVFQEGTWQAYSNKDLGDLYSAPTDVTLSFSYPDLFNLFSELDQISENTVSGVKTTELFGENRVNLNLHLNINKRAFDTYVTEKGTVITGIPETKLPPTSRALIIDRILHFIDKKLGPYPHNEILISNQDYKRNPVYGFNQLPSFISPFPNGFEFDLEHFKSISGAMIDNVLLLNPREDYWLKDAIHIYLLKEYVDTYYPNQKIIGSLSNFWIIKWSHLSELEFNDQYSLLYQNMVRNNLQQSLSTPLDSLVKYNANIAQGYYGAEGLSYLADYIGKEKLDHIIKSYYTSETLKPTQPSSFQEKVKAATDLPTDWFFDDFVNKRNPLDFKISRVKKSEDSLTLTLKNKHNSKIPVSVYALNKQGEIISKKWTQPFDSTTRISFKRQNIDKFVLNQEQIIPETNKRNNFRKIGGFLNRPVQFRLFQDVQDHRYNQLFAMPVFEYNLYDGLTTGFKFYNKTLLPKPLQYKIEPQYGFASKSLVGSGNFIYTKYYNDNSPYAIKMGISGNRFSYNKDLFYKRITPFMTFSFRNDDIRDNEKQFISIRNINVFKDENPNDLNQDPNYSVFNIGYTYSNPNLINHFSGKVDYELSSNFSKIAATFSYRKLFLNNRQLNIRAFAGAFLFNETRNNGNFFSFALDRPTDYLFDYNYYGRSEDDGLFSQQLIVAEGGFKSQLEPAFADSWITTINASTNIWKWIYAYGDVGLVGNKNLNTKAVFDSGIRLSLVADYFELYFPMYSSLGWEPGLPNYDEKIRFIVTLTPNTLFKLFTREWY
ncbi:Aminopeptidase N [unidentified eubacterium SCB49]|nr:Aminopeptidase N [unidentified eubacterium SCB49]